MSRNLLFFKQNRLLIIPSAFLIILSVLFLLTRCESFFLWSGDEKQDVPQKSSPARPKYVRGIHLTAWVTGSPKILAPIDALLDETELNAVVIDIKEYEGEVYIPGNKATVKNKTYVPAIPGIRKYLVNLKSRGIYTIARMVVFKDNLIPKIKPELAVRDASGTVWTDYRGNTWLDPYNKDGWDYNISIAETAVDLGFDEIQFDYIRFPSDGNIRTCRYGQSHSTTSAVSALSGFLREANRRLKPKGVNISIDVFGLTTTSLSDMGIGQRIVEMAEWVDYVSPMVYPSHYYKGEYGIPDPNSAPYQTVFLAAEGAKNRMGAYAVKLRPYLQDFSMGYKYGKEEVRAQIQACYDNDIGDWLLWNPRCVYTRSALKGKDFSDIYDKSENINELMNRRIPGSDIQVSSETLAPGATEAGQNPLSPEILEPPATAAIETK
ncbi:MAG: putative glycoside hydrolase [Elusimicrobiota bacterium]